MTAPRPRSRFDLDGLQFAMVSSSASTVNPLSPTLFRYHERYGIVWGEYEGDTVRIGRFVGTRTDQHLSVRFTHVVSATGEIVGGSADTRIEDDGDRLRLVESFRAADVVHVSVCAQVGDAETVTDPDHPADSSG